VPAVTPVETVKIDGAVERVMLATETSRTLASIVRR